MFKSTLILFTFIIVSKANALVIDTMFLISDQKGNGVISLTNDFEQASYITTKIEEINVDQNQSIVRTPYNKENIDTWKIMTTHPKLILEGKITKDIGIRALCGEKCAIESDMVFSVAFEPAPYFAEGETPNNTVNINYGYAAIYVIPTANGRIDYDIKNRGESLEVFNKGNTLVSFVIDYCSPSIKENCRLTERVIAGRKRMISLPENLRKDALVVKAYNHDETYKQQHTVALTR
ncbi:hypothetical protein CKQ84_06635 [Shewanella sp. WE21]|uniref:hypothetical protein n=1 Tax=Shewanella sp. WE21 TaxID=2029986 RepID=UPI000CF68D68|nr:hypothetical protein [Shewanella sp. WE21]AVI65588.1 hypothetical protein CKQ84_06635 [Shewanella sp. WE21]